MPRSIVWIGSAAAALVSASAMADTQFVSLAGFESYGFYGTAGNSSITLSLGVGTQITGIDFVDFAFTGEGSSWLSDLVVSVNDSSASLAFWDSTVPGAANAPGTFGPVSAPFSNPGVFGSGPFTMTTSDLYITVYDSFDDNGPGLRDSVVNSGGILITYNVPAPGALAAFALAGLASRRRRRA